jgi:hypothetical protein
MVPSSGWVSKPIKSSGDNLIGCLFDLEDGDRTFLWNVGELLTDLTASHRHRYSYKSLISNLISNFLAVSVDRNETHSRMSHRCSVFLLHLANCISVPTSASIISWAQYSWPVSFIMKPLFNVRTCFPTDRNYLRARSNRGPEGLMALLMFKARSGERRSRAFGPLWKPLMPRLCQSLVDISIFANEPVRSCVSLKNTVTALMKWRNELPLRNPNIYYTFYSTCHSWASWMHSTVSHVKFLLSTLIISSHLRFGSVKCSPPLRFSDLNVLCISEQSSTCYLPRPSYCPLFDRRNSVW